MDPGITDKREVFTPQEIDLTLCALLHYLTELRNRSHLMRRFASAEHLRNHLAKIELGEKLLADLSCEQPLKD